MRLTPPEKPAPRAECPWCRETKSIAVLAGSHMQTRACIALGHEKRAKERGLVPLGYIVDDYGWRVQDWFPVLLRGRAPFEILPTRAQRKGNQCSRERGWYDMRGLWVPSWVNTLLAAEPSDAARVGRVGSSVARRDVFTHARELVALFRWAGRDPKNAAALAVVHASARSRRRGVPTIAEQRAALFELFFAANPSKRPASTPPVEKRDSEDLQESESEL